MHTPPLLQSEGWSVRYILYPDISKFESLAAVSEFKNVFETQMIPNLEIRLDGVNTDTFE